MNALDYKLRYRNKWSIAAVREKVVYEWLKYYCSQLGLKCIPSGIGTLSDRYNPYTFNGTPEQKYDFIIVDERGEILCYVDVTGYGGREPCFLSYKVMYALERGIANRVVLIHVNDSTGAIRWVTAQHLADLMRKGKTSLKKLYKDEKNYICTTCTNLSYLNSLPHFLAFLKKR